MANLGRHNREFNGMFSHYFSRKIAFSFLLFFSIGGCAEKSSNELGVIGMWVSHGYTKELTKDKSQYITNSPIGSFKWEIKDNGKLKMYAEEMVEDFPYKRVGNTLIVEQWGFPISHEIVEISLDEMIIKNGATDSYYYYKKES